MLTIQMPHIAVQKVTNGYVVQWQKRNPDEKNAQRTIAVSAVCLDTGALLEAINIAAGDVADVGG